MAGPTRVNTPEIPQLVEHKLAAPLQAYFTDLSAFIQREFRRRSEDSTPQPSVLLQAPNGFVYSVSVDNAGVLSTALVSSS